MKVSIVNFSDVHFISDKDSILEKKDKIIKAIISRTRDADKILYIMNGDSAFGGKEEQYNLAFDFFQDIISKTNGNDFFCVPGNHDCDFEQMDTEMRKVVIDAINNSEKDQTSMINEVIIQKNYDTYSQIFYDNWSSDIKVVNENEIVKSIDILIKKEVKIKLNLFNTAWDSTINEKPGTMYMPKSRLKDVKYDNNAVFNISVIHHPTNWLEPNNKREFDKLLNNVSDLILSGHEHADNVISQNSIHGETTLIEGSVLQENSLIDKSGFNIINIYINTEKIDQNKQILIQFEWDAIKKIYTVSEESNLNINTSSKVLNHLHVSGNNHFLLSELQLKFINEIGAPILHPRLSDLKLDDIYIHPVLKDNDLVDNQKSMSGEKLFEELITDIGLWLIEVERDAGKTTLLKKIYNHYFDKKIIPLYIDAETIKDNKILKNTQKFIEKNFNKQYKGDVYEEYLQLEKEDRVILLDNWKSCQLNQKGKQSLLSELINFSDRVIIMVKSSPSNNSDLIEISNGLDVNVRYKEIKNFGYKKREELVEKWIRLGNEYTLEDREIIIKVDQYRKQVDEIIGKSYVPQIPIYILIILQTMDSGRDLTDFNNQSNAYYYELLIKQLIIDMGIGSNEISTLHTYLNHFAYKIFNENEKSINHSDWKKFHENYLEQFEVDEEKASFDHYKKQLIDSNIIKKFNEDRFSFNYNYFMYFFTAQYLAENISESSIKSIVKKLIENIDIELNANVLIFLSHLSKDSFILRTVISVSNTILEDTPTLKMEEDIKELNDLMTELPTLILENTNTKENRKRYNEIKDLDETGNKHYTEEATVSSSPDKETLVETNDGTFIEKNTLLIQMNKAQRISEVIGQILKNYSGSIPAEMKHQLIDSAYSVSLRSGTMLIDIIKSEKEDLVSFISTKISKDKLIKTDNPKEVEKAAKRMVFQFVEMVCYSIVQKSVKDTGTKALKKTYENIQKKDISTVIKLIISGSYLETMYVSPSNGHIHEFFSELDKNLLVKSILQRMVAKYMYLFELPPDERQKIASKFGIVYDPVVKARIKNS